MANPINDNIHRARTFVFALTQAIRLQHAAIDIVKLRRQIDDLPEELHLERQVGSIAEHAFVKLAGQQVLRGEA